MALAKVGDTLDIFTLCSELHEGPLATIFLAEDLLSRQQVVLKIPCGDILNKPILLYHYQNEDRISRLLDHPGIIRFIHRQRSRQYIIMEYVDGKDLRARIGKNRVLELSEALHLMDQLCNVVSYLHENTIVHLDLKPENIICCRDDTIKVLDFGLASCRHLPDLLALDLKNPLGTPWYIAPEQLLGERSDPRCDIYTMGMLFYEMLTGSLPWPRSSKLQVARRRLRHDPAPPRYYNNTIPPQIQSIILRAISRHAEDRYGSVVDLQYDLMHWQQLPATDGGSGDKLPSVWRRLFPGRAVQLRSEQAEGTTVLGDKPQIIGGLIDDSGSENMLAELKKQALIRSAEITLVHVIEEESDSRFRRYGITVEGEKLMAWLERAVQLLRRCSIDPSIRLVRGEVAQVLVDLSLNLDAELLVLGRSCKKRRLLRSASALRRLEKKSPCPLMVGEEQKFLPVTDLAALQPDQLTPDQVLSCDIFLVDLWYEHLKYQTDFIYRKLLYPGTDIDLSVEHCRLGRFLTSLETSDCWQRVTADLGAVHQRFHQVAVQMAKLCIDDHAGLQDLYIQESLPLSCALKKELGEVSSLLRAPLDSPPPLVPFLTDQTCPVTNPDLARYGPLLRAFDLDQDLCVLVRNKEKNSLDILSQKSSRCD
jgi:serine/threonine protein kinase